MWRSASSEVRSTNGFRLRCRLPLTEKHVNHRRSPTRHGQHLLYDHLLPLVDPALSRFTSDRAPQFSHTPPPYKVLLQATQHSSTLSGSRRLIRFARWPVPLFVGDPDVEPHGRLQPCDTCPCQSLDIPSCLTSLGDWYRLSCGALLDKLWNPLVYRI